MHKELCIILRMGRMEFHKRMRYALKYSVIATACTCDIPQLHWSAVMGKLTHDLNSCLSVAPFLNPFYNKNIHQVKYIKKMVHCSVVLQIVSCPAEGP